MLPLQISLTALVALLLAIFIARSRFAADILAAADLFRAPLYVIGKMRLYLDFVNRREHQWIRTKRDPP